MASEHSSLDPTLHEITPATIGLGLVRYPPPSTPVDPPALEVIAPIAKVVALEPVKSIGLPSSTTVDQDAPSPSNSETTPETQSPVISNDVEEENHDLDISHMNNDPFFGIPIPENDSESSSSDVIPTIVHTAAPNSEHITQWTKDHPLDNIIVARHDAIQIFLAFAAYMNMIVYQMDVKTISQSPKGIFLNQSKYAFESLKKYYMESSDPIDTPMVEKSKLDEDPKGKVVDPTHYCGMVGTLMYLTPSSLNLTFIDSSIALTAYTDVDHAGCQDTRQSTSGKQVENRIVEIYFVNTEYQLADIFTKALRRERIEFLINKLGMRSFMPETLIQLVDEAKE
nr:hypothetical protein [Tanacetum cinerariifolium]